MALSTFTWLDHREEDATRVREALAAFDQPGMLDPLGFGVVRDAFSEALFPGISTVQTRARYFLLVPWAYQWLEEERVRPNRAVARARELEAELIASLLRGSVDRTGIIGQTSGAATVQMPSFIYWGGLETLGVRRFSGTRRDYTHSAYQRATWHRNHDPDEPTDVTDAWHPDLPPEPDGLWEATTLELLPDEAAFLADRILDSVGDTYLAHLVRTASAQEHGDLPWTHLRAAEAPRHIREQLHHARLFAFAALGAGLLYNWVLSDKLEGEQGEGLEADYEQAWKGWVAEIEGMSADYARWDVPEFWASVYRQNPAVSSSHRDFTEWWLQLVIAGPADIDRLEAEKRLIARESRLKGPRAKLANRAARERYPTAQGDSLMTYRWPVVSRIVGDILDGLALA